MIPNRRTHPPPNSIAIHGSAQDFADRKAYTRDGVDLVLAIKSRHISGEMLPALFVHYLEVSMLQ
jgi:hypothetical protein